MKYSATSTSIIRNQMVIIPLILLLSCVFITSIACQAQRNRFMRDGEQYFEEGRYEEAIECYDKAIKINANYAFAWLCKGAALQRLGKIEEAIACFDEAIEINPNDAEVWFIKGAALYMLGRDYEGDKALQKAHELSLK